ncbi:MAG TPA: hypothetical protein VFK41_02610 [Nocardioidaceae bacterium]|nr:hypothetical protein [Nocardioidaceae bacterium]
MTEEDFPGGIGREIAEAAERPLDADDLALLAEVQRLYDEIDTVPDDLVERVQFALALDEVFAEVAHLTRMPLDALAVRGEAVTGTRTETLTFSAERLTAMVTVSRLGDRLRIDGWIAPPAELEIRLRMQGERRQVTADASGRFVIDNLPEGFAQLSFHPIDVDDADGVIVTPLFQL